MNLLFVGSGKGSWSIRGEQMGAYLGARVTSAPSDADWRWADLAVLVKRVGFMFAATAHRAGVPIVWDALDFWRQPADNSKSEASAVGMLAEQVKTIRPALTIGATHAMAQAAHGVALEHHSWPGLEPMPAREHVQVVAYQGNPVFVGAWRTAFERACERRGWQFVMNPADISEADILVAVRNAQWDGWMCREWKSGVKVVNAQAAGRPLITQPSAAFREIGHAGTVIDGFNEIDAALDAWTSEGSRATVVEQCRARFGAYTIDAIATRYAAILSEVGVSCPAA